MFTQFAIYLPRRCIINKLNNNVLIPITIYKPQVLSNPMTKKNFGINIFFLRIIVILINYISSIFLTSSIVGVYLD